MIYSLRICFFHRVQIHLSYTASDNGLEVDSLGTYWANIYEQVMISLAYN